MSRYDYLESMKLGDAPFYALIMAAMRRADTGNLDALKLEFYQVWCELQLRYNAPDGVLEGIEAEIYGR